MHDTELQQQLATVQERSYLLQEELAETNRGLIALELEYDAQLHTLYDELAKTNSELVQLTLELEDRVAQRVAELRQAEERYRNIFENAVEGIFQYSSDGQFLTTNPALAQMLGYETVDELLNGVTDIEDQLFADREHGAEFRQKLQEQSVVRGFETRFRRQDGQVIWVSLNVRVVYHEHDETFHYEGTAEDITARRQAEGRLRELNAELEQRVAERTAQMMSVNKELEAFSYSVSHDLRAPLRVIDGFSKVLVETYADQLDDKGKHYIERIRAASGRMGQLIDDLLRLARMSRSEFCQETVDLSALVRDIVTDLQESQPERSVRLTLPDDVVVPGDAHLLRVALENLLRNAWKFTGKTLDPHIEFGVAHEDGTQV